MLVDLPALMGALYTGYFMSPRMRGLVKPTIEIMEALPTVILGFLAGLWFAPFVESHLPAVFSVVLLMPLGMVVVAFVWHVMKSRLTRTRKPSGWGVRVMSKLTPDGSKGSRQHFSGTLSRWLASGAPMIWLTAGAVAISLVMVLELVSMIAVRGLGHFWPNAIVETTVTQPDGTETRLLEELSQSETVTAVLVAEAGFEVPEGVSVVGHHLFKLGNRDLTGRDFQWFVDHQLGEWSYPSDALVLERTEWGNLYGYLRSVSEAGQVVAKGEAAWEELFARVRRAGPSGSRPWGVTA